ncbi:hypothetical protein [Flavisphingomonas formosensis]|uniref:hypothetical protein n=1 Tax=Flavisphingomonas formosensis TaxID=861534 RepID=UPI0012FC06DB|nr:hypothetical protein [Sphingomonas formosensis]
MDQPPKSLMIFRGTCGTDGHCITVSERTAIKDHDRQWSTFNILTEFTIRKEIAAMAKPPASPPSSDIDGVDRDGRPGLVSRDTRPDPGRALKTAQELSAGRPKQSPPLGESAEETARKRRR